MLLDLSPDQKLFASTTRSFLAGSCATNDLRALRDDPDGFVPAFWVQGAELGWTSLLVDERDGGGSVSGEGLVDLVLAAFEFGRYAAPGPLTPVNVVARTLSRVGSADQRSLLAGLLAGEEIAAWASSPRSSIGAQGLRATLEGDTFVISGHARAVEAAAQADVLLVTATDGDGVSQFLVAPDAPGVAIRPMKTVDLTQRFGSVRLDGVRLPQSALVGVRSKAQRDVDDQFRIADVVTLSAMVGAWDRALEITLEWLFNRFSFGRPLASYQELKHRFVDSRAWWEAGAALTSRAATLVQQDSPRAQEYVSAAKAFVGEFGPDSIHDCVQMHGGIGLTFEHDLHLFLRRVVLGSAVYGTAADHRETLTTILEAEEDERA